MQNIQAEFIITVNKYINKTSFKMKGSSDLGQAVITLVRFFLKVFTVQLFLNCESYKFN